MISVDRLLDENPNAVQKNSKNKIVEVEGNFYTPGVHASSLIVTGH